MKAITLYDFGSAKMVAEMLGEDFLWITRFNKNVRDDEWKEDAAILLRPDDIKRIYHELLEEERRSCDSDEDFKF